MKPTDLYAWLDARQPWLWLAVLTGVLALAAAGWAVADGYPAAPELTPLP